MPTCYRHTDRETGVACSNCERPICPDCMTTTSVGMRCPECARDRTPVRTVQSLERVPTLTYALIGSNLLVAVAVFLSGASAISFGGGSLLDALAVSQVGIARGEVWRLVSAGFVHAGMLHLAFNMFALYVLGGLLEPAIGKLRFGLIYFVSLLAGSFGALLLTAPNVPTVGASGAVFGMMGAAIVVMRNRGINPMESGLGLWLGLNLAITFLIPGISIGGHIGGLVGGALAAVLLFEVGDRVRLPAIVPAAAVALLGGLAVAGSLAVSYG
ncbi:MAG: rhomboid family intramembrane serine protease [Thermoleophilaceae bacterium]|nr:rhomboid family intramembrane serine protease [Thermoleophilaceae bacterium]MDQ3319583.1 rhomboid family intramembrane serine protease [Actinomycetota bacterium]